MRRQMLFAIRIRYPPCAQLAGFWDVALRKVFSMKDNKKLLLLFLSLMQLSLVFLPLAHAEKAKIAVLPLKTPNFKRVKT